MANRRKDITGNRYGKLVAVNPTGADHKGLYRWDFLCDCGGTINRSITFVSKIKPGVISHCGCDHHLRKHGMSTTIKKLYWVWLAMRQRCNNSDNKDYRNYGGRGITIDDNWNDYSKFHEWALPSGYREGVTIERVDVNLNYTPDNCAWVVNEKQALNTRKIRTFEYRGLTYTLRELSELSGVKLNTMKTRLTSLGWSVDRAMGDDK